jgi:signal transduction histidine kinase
MLKATRPSPLSFAAALAALASVLLLLSPPITHVLFETNGFAPHGYCILWQPTLTRIYITADTLIGLSYVTISLTLAYLVYRARSAIPFHWVLLAFGVFILACGSGHFVDVWTLWTPMYWLSGTVKVITAVASVATAIVLPPLVPRALALIEAAKTSDQRKKQLEIANQELQLEIAERERAELEIQRTNALVRLLQAVAVASNTALTLEDAILTCLREICMYTGWLVGHAYLPADDGSGDLVSTPLWYLADFDRFATFRKVTEATPLTSGADLPGRVLASWRPIWIADITNDPSFVRGKLISGLGIKAAFAFPVMMEDEVSAVLEFFSPDAVAPDPPLLELMMQVGAQVAWAAERQRAEAALKTVADQLARSNRELGDFATMASHDLQEPLRKVRAFADLLVEQYGPALDAEARDYLERMQNAARRMQALIHDLLALSRIDHKAQPFAPVDLAVVAREVVADLELRIAQTGGHLELGDLPTIEAEPLQMRQLLQNLIGNALKFHRPNVPPVVKLHSRMVASQRLSRGAGAHSEVYYEISVEDNGIGFDEKYLDRIFGVFQRLHGRGAYEGTGIGLAVCRKIAERHGGSITATSTLGQGASFLVTLPAHQPAGRSTL